MKLSVNTEEKYQYQWGRGTSLTYHQWIYAICTNSPLIT